MRTNGAVVPLLLALGMFVGCTGQVGDLDQPDPLDVVETELRGRNCGDGQCRGAETCSSCAVDCGVCAPTPPPVGPVCGNATCESGESCSSCPGDCGACATTATPTPAPSTSTDDAGSAPAVDGGTTAASDGGIPADARTIVGAQVVGSTKALISFAGAQRTDEWGVKWLWILSETAGLGFGTCSSGWDTSAQVGLINLYPGRSYRLEIEYVNGVRSPAKTFVAPALSPESNAPTTAATATGSTSCNSLSVSASDDTGVKKTEFYVNGTLVGTQECGANCMNVQAVPVTNGVITGMGTYYIAKPANLVGTAVTVHAKVYDYFGNSTATTPITLSL